MQVITSHLYLINVLSHDIKGTIPAIQKRLVSLNWPILHKQSSSRLLPCAFTEVSRCAENAIWLFFQHGQVTSFRGVVVHCTYANHRCSEMFPRRAFTGSSDAQSRRLILRLIGPHPAHEAVSFTVASSSPFACSSVQHALITCTQSTSQDRWPCLDHRCDESRSSWVLESIMPQNPHC